MGHRFPMHLWRFALGFALAMLGACASDSTGFLVVVESSYYEPLAASLDAYAKSLEAEGFEVYVEPWESDSVADLKELLFEHVDRHGVEGALLVGELPAATYEGIFHTYYEQFPTDLYLQDRDAIWTDRDGDGMFDEHSELFADIYTSRLVGTESQLRDYFARVEHYRHIGPLVDVSAFIFLDDDWANKDASDLFHLDEIYDSVEVIQDPAESTLDRYVRKLTTGGGAEFVYHWIHGNWDWIEFWDLPVEAPTKPKLEAKFVSVLDFKVSFLNMASCKSANFTKDSVASAFVVGTHYGLAVIGSTGIGAATNPRIFHDALADGKTWGQAYRVWYNQEGKNNDAWNLGIVLIGDPLLTVGGNLTAHSNADPVGGD